MPVNKEVYQQIFQQLGSKGVTLVAVSKTKPPGDIQELYDLGHRDFGENYVQELTEKASLLPTDIRWHFIGHLQSNKVKYIAPFVHMVQGVDSGKLLEEINKQAARYGRVVDCLLQVYIAKEETKFGLDETELEQLIAMAADARMAHVRVCGLMGMASFSDNMELVRNEFRYLRRLFDKHVSSFASPGILSMGMSSDYTVAIEEGSTLVRIGSLLFGARN